MLTISAKPFNLTEDQVVWVEATFKAMSFDEKIGQLFCASSTGINTRTINDLCQKYKVGGLMIRQLPVKNLQNSLRKLQNASAIPLLLAANLENGGRGAITEGTYYAMPMGCAATGDLTSGYRLGKISCQEAVSVGLNWSFAPIVDIDMNYHNPITNIRSFSSNKQVVMDMARGYIQAAKEEGVIPTIKHFPGDGTDERDQHLLVSVNQLDADAWFDTFGSIYKTLIDDGAPAIMAGHIAQPAVSRAIQPDISDADAFLPATQSKTLIKELLRNRLGFNGLIVTDSTLMVGFMQSMPRKKSIPLSIECGVDMILFSKSIDEDIRYMKQGIADGILSQERMDEAVMRILALKAMTRLPEKKANGNIVPNTNPMQIIESAQTKAWVAECADKAITLVKDNNAILPISPQKTKRVYLNVIENYVSNKSAFAMDIRRRLEKEGFAVELRKRELNVNPNNLLNGIPSPALIKALKEIMSNTESFISKYDISLIIVNMETVSNATVVRINWSMLFGLGNDIPWYAGEMPLVVVSTANPYHLLDIPMSDVYINAYSNSDATLDALFEKLMGRSEFKGISPVDPFCGHEDCKL